MSQAKDNCKDVFREFIKQYYHVLHKMPQMRAKFYKDNSSWTMRDGEIEVDAQGLGAINRAFAECPLNGARVDFGYAHAQMTFNEIFNIDENGDRTTEGIFILVYGSMELNGEGGKPRERLFQQAFMLTRKERHGNVMYYCRNDAFAFVGDVDHAVASAVDDKGATTQAVAPTASSASTTKASTEAAPEHMPEVAASQQSNPEPSSAAAPKQPKQAAAPKQEAVKKGAAAGKKAKLSAKQDDQAAKKGASGKASNSASNKGNNAANKRGTKQQQTPKAPAEKKTWAALAATAPQPGQPRTLVKRGNTAAKNQKNSSKAGGQGSGNNKAEGGNSAGNNSSKGGRATGSSSGNECSLYVKEIPENTTEAEVRTQFGKFGKITEVAINKGYLFVTFTEVSAAVAALAAKDKIMISGKSVKVEKRKVDGGQKKGGNNGGASGGRSGRGSRRGSGNGGAGRGGRGGGRGRSSGNRGGSSRSRRNGGGGGGGAGDGGSGSSNRGKK